MIIRTLALAVLAAAAASESAADPSDARVIRDVAYLEPGRAEKLDVYLPERAPSDPPSPAVVWIHGGGWINGSKKEDRALEVCRCLSAAGYVCASIDYRLGPGAWPTDLFDCKNAIRFLRVHAADYHVDPERIAVMGGSAGGHLALMVGLTSGDPELEPPGPYPGVGDGVWAVGDFYGPTDPLTRQAVAADGTPLGTPKPQRGPASVFGAVPEANPGLWRNLAPVNHVRPDSPAVLIVHGKADPVVDYPQSLELERALTRNGVPHELVLLEGVGHAFDLESWGQKRLPRDLRPVVLSFLRQYFAAPAHGMAARPPAVSPRTETSLSGPWKFSPADNVHGPEPQFDDSAWESVSLPHTWNSRDGQAGGKYRRGAAWYRLHLRPDPALAGRRLYLQFDGVSLAADVYVNGTLIGGHKGGFARFRLDATDSLRPGRDNLVSVRVDNGELGIPPVSADFTFFGGIYRPVSLLSTGQIQISATDYGSSGVYLDQVEVTPKGADLTVRTEVESYAEDKTQVEVHARLYDAAGREVAAAGNRGTLKGGDAVEERQRLYLPRPHLWAGTQDPYLYTLKVEIVADKVLVDSVSQQVGLRSFRLDPDRGFFLNGKHLDLHGVGRHQDRLDKGWAIGPADEAEDFDLVRELGCTAVRAAHYQQADSWYQRCDREGLVVWAEIPFVNEALPSPEFRDSAKQQLRELIRQNYNHPSICFWGVGNETKGESADLVVTELADVARAQDATRLCTYASNADPKEAVNWRTDTVGFNRYLGWYSGSYAELPAWLDSVHRLHPKSPFALSEFGAGASIFEHEDRAVRPDPKGAFHPEEYQARLHEASWLALKERPYVWGKFVWNLADFASAQRSEGDHAGRNDKGLVTYDRRVRKDSFYWYKANWNPEPLVWIASRRFFERRKASADVTVYSNAPEVELWVDGQSRGTLHSDNRLFRWPSVALHPGENHVAATARFGDLAFTDACTWISRAPAAPAGKP